MLLLAQLYIDDTNDNANDDVNDNANDTVDKSLLHRLIGMYAK